MLRTHLIGLVWALALWGGQLAAQQATFATPGQRTPGYWTLGLNAGLSYQTSDIKALPFAGGGLGLTLAKNLYYAPGSPFAFDLRGRLLYARQQGIDGQRSFDLANNPALNGQAGPDYTRYPLGLGVDPGFVYQNHQTRVGELALEGVLSFNRLRERTGVILGLYGGIGLDWYQVRTNQLDETGAAYYTAYANLDPNLRAGQARRELRNQILDDTYETPAGATADNGSLALMPSLGVELGYQLTPRFSLHLGHRLTFAGHDDLDGHRWADAANDRYHYTHLAARWILQPVASRKLAPVIRVTEPDVNPYTTTRREVVVRATIDHVRSAADVYSELNGRGVSFDFAGSSYRCIMPLQPGRNELVITATNDVGSDRAVVVVILEGNLTAPPTPPIGNTGRPPSVLITFPNSDPYRTPDATVFLRASVQDATDRNAVELLVNGVRQAFDFDQNGQLTANLRLQTGDNRVEVRARNNWGAASADLLVVRQAAEPPPPAPERLDVRITAPANGSRTDQSRQVLRANLTGVTDQRAITVTVNGRRTNDFSFDPRRGELSATVLLQRGANRLEVSATERGASATDQVSVELVNNTPPPPPPPPPTPNAPPVNASPTVRITTPADRSTTDRPEADLVANVTNIRTASQLTVSLNGRQITNFNFDAARGRLTARLSLTAGNNTVRVEARNNAGQSQDGVNVTYTPPLPPPTVDISSPANGANVTNPRVNVLARTTRIDNPGQLELTLDGRRIDGFSFSPSRQELTANLDLTAGEHTIVVRARTPGGNAEDQVRVRYTPPLPPPTVDITSPANGANVTNPRVNVLARTTMVDNPGQLELTLDGRRIDGFSFSPSRQELTANLDLTAGEHTIVVRARTPGGNAEDQVRVRYTPPLPPPTVDISSPANGANVTNPRVNVLARTTRVDNPGQLELTLDGRRIDGFSFSPSRQELTANLDLTAGEHTIVVRARTPGGNAEDQVRVRYTPALPLPTVDITSPANGALLTTNTTNVTATITAVTDPARVRVLVNGRAQRDFQFANGRLSATVGDLQVGNNRIRVEADNTAGSQADEIEVRYQPTPATTSAPAPLITFVQPRAPGLESKTETINVEAQVQHVRAAADVRVWVNDQPFPDFSFAGRGGVVSFALTLRQGVTHIRIEASNAQGQANAATSVVYNPVSALAPVITIESISIPVENPMSPGLGPSTLRATVRNVTEAGQMTLLVNGTLVNNFTFDPRSGVLTAQFQLKRGANTVVLQATTREGTAEERRDINI